MCVCVCVCVCVCACVLRVCVRACVLKKKYIFFFEDWIFFFKIGEKSHINFIGNGAEFWPLRTPKTSVLIENWS